MLLRDDERLDDLQRNHYGIIQRKGVFCFGMDAVLLSGFAAVKKGERVLDLHKFYHCSYRFLPFFSLQRRRGSISQVWRSRRSQRTWPAAVSVTTI